MKKRFLCLTFALFLTVMFSSCSGTGAGSPDAVPADGYVIDGSSIQMYGIVRSETAEQEIVQCGMDIRAAFAEAGYDLSISTDFYREGFEDYYSIGDYEILVGDTNRPETQEFLDRLQMWQYGYALIGQKLVIAGHDADTTRQAVEEFKKILSARSPFFFSEADNYIFGEVKEGEGKIYSMLTYNFDGAAVSDVLSEMAEYAPDILILQNAEEDIAGQLTEQLSGYALGAEYLTDTKYNLIYYNTDTYTYSSAGHLVMAQIPTISAEEKGSFTYCVVRCAETGQKYVFCAADLSGVAPESVGSRMNVFGSFAENCGSFPVLFGGLYDGAAESAACESLTSYGFADTARLAPDSEGECTENYIYATYDNIAAVKSVVTETGIYMEFQHAK